MATASCIHSINFAISSIDITESESENTEPRIIGCSKLLLSTKVFNSTKYTRLPLILPTNYFRRPIDVVNDSYRYECNITSISQFDLTNSAVMGIDSGSVCKLLRRTVISLHY